jgi:cephalosporin-C deacetylase-like acetyl esterase
MPPGLAVQSGFMTRGSFLLLAALAVPLWSAGTQPWDWKDLEAVPETFEAPHNDEPGVKAIWFAGLPYKGKPTRVFAYYGVPANAQGKKVPAMVLIHGGGGTAFAEWVRMWNARGYAAIAMDTVGTIPAKATDEKTTWNPAIRRRTEFSGPAGWGDFTNVDLPPRDQWSYHAVAAAIRAHSLLRSFAEVDVKRVGVTGISWGGYLTSMVAGLDARFRFAAPVYGCGYLGEDSAWLKNFAELGPQRAERWLSLWDPSQYVGRARMPMLWVNGTNDFAYPPNSWRKTHRLAKGPKTLAYRVRMPHGHQQGAKPEEIFQFADHILRKGPAPARVKRQGFDNDRAWVRFSSRKPITKAELAYTRDGGKWQDRKWEIAPAELSKGSASAAVPADAKAFYLNLFDAEGRVVSAEHYDR